MATGVANLRQPWSWTAPRPPVQQEAGGPELRWTAFVRPPRASRKPKPHYIYDYDQHHPDGVLRPSRIEIRLR
jgi:hypothetical protein